MPSIFYKIIGKILDQETNKPLIRATVTIHTKNDSSQVADHYTG